MKEYSGAESIEFQSTLNLLATFYLIVDNMFIFAEFPFVKEIFRGAGCGWISIMSIEECSSVTLSAVDQLECGGEDHLMLIQQNQHSLALELLQQKTKKIGPL